MRILGAAWFVGGNAQVIETQQTLTGTASSHKRFASELVQAENKASDAHTALDRQNAKVDLAKSNLDDYRRRVLPWAHDLNTIYSLWDIEARQGTLDLDSPYSLHLGELAAANDAADEASNADDDVLIHQVTATASAGAVRSLQKELTEAQDDTNRRLTVGAAAFLAAIAAATIHIAISARRRRAIRAWAIAVRATSVPSPR
jgi:hypothetical protein